MDMHRTLWIAFVLAFLGMTCLGQTAKPLGSQLRVRWNGFNIIVIKDGTKHSFDVSKDINGWNLTSIKLLSAKESDNFIYLLFDLDGNSRSPEAAMHYCGAGVERSLVWVKLDQAWKKADSRSFVIESCFNNAELDELESPLTFKGSELIANGSTMRYPGREDMSNNVWRYEIKYSYKHPEAGLQIKLELMKKETSHPNK
jgi:hypothetical protein